MSSLSAMTATGPKAALLQAGDRRRLSRWGRMRRIPGLLGGLLVIVLLVVIAVTAPVLAPYDPNFQDYAAVLQPPNRAHPFGTDNLGRDIFSRIVFGAQVSLQVGIIAVGIATIAGTSLGLIAGYFGGWIDDTIMRISDAVFAFPALLLILAIASALKPSLGATMAAIGIVFSPVYARMIRGEVLSLRQLEYVTAARAIGMGSFRIMVWHILPNGLAPIIVLASLSVSGAILTEATLSFLGVGVPPPTPSWGGMLQIGYQYVQVAPWLSIFPGLMIFISVLAFNIFGDGLRTLLDPHLRR